MNNQKETIRKFVNYINNSSHLGGFWLPNIQRPFVWKEEQIEKLYDSILREYPIGTLLVWKNKNKIKHRKFIDNWIDGLNLLHFFVPINETPKMLVLDGQQRMQSLYIGLKGSYNGKELYFNVLSGEAKTPDDRKFLFKFYKESLGFPWVKFSTLVFPDKRTKEFKAEIRLLAGKDLDNQADDRIEENIEIIRKTFCQDDNILYQEVDSIDRPSAYSEDDIVEIFIRANSGGTKLDKSDLLFSLLVSSWDEANENMTTLLDELNKDGYDFGRDFVLKTCLVLFEKGASYEVAKFRDGDTKQKIEENWERISNAIKDVKDFIKGRTFIQNDKALTSYLALIPLIYFRYHYPEKWSSTPKINEYLVRTMLMGVFSGGPDGLIDKLVKKIKEDSGFVVSNVYGAIRDDNRTLELTLDNLLNLSYTDRRIHLLFNLWYDFNYTPAYNQNAPSIDHIFPQSILKKVKMMNPETGRKSLTQYPQPVRDQLANLMLLTKQENGAGNKWDQSPERWFAGKDQTYLDLHLIPNNPDLWKLENFEQFLDARKQLILKKFDYLLTKTQ
ncbi:DUF262 domain-containing protein [Haliscomenobacter sp.]|uniref:DUF262 domain-containing protein n=1 Tax=Haliscomenobacter sp. TaxID=2717303 RepID=UPI00359376CA